jgi:phosphopantetheinyl transferase
MVAVAVAEDSEIGIGIDTVPDLPLELEEDMAVVEPARMLSVEPEPEAAAASWRWQW